MVPFFLLRYQATEKDQAQKSDSSRSRIVPNSDPQHATEEGCRQMNDSISSHNATETTSGHSPSSSLIHDPLKINHERKDARSSPETASPHALTSAATINEGNPKPAPPTLSSGRPRPQKTVEALLAQKKLYQRHLRHLQQTHLARQLLGKVNRLIDLEKYYFI